MKKIFTVLICLYTILIIQTSTAHAVNVTVNVKDQNGSDIPGANVFIDGTFFNAPVTRDLSLGDHNFQVSPLTQYNNLYRIETQTVTTSTTELVIEWKTATFPVKIVDQFGNLFPEGGFAVESIVSGKNNQDIITLPINDKTVYPNIQGSIATAGYGIIIAPDSQPPTIDLYRKEYQFITPSTTELVFEWKTATFPVKIVDQNATLFPNGAFFVTLGSTIYNWPPNNTTITLPTNDKTVYPTIQGNPLYSFGVSVLPGGSLYRLENEIISPSLTEKLYEWKTATLPIKITDQNNVLIPNAEFFVTLGSTLYNFTANNSSVTLPTNDKTVYANIVGTPLYTVGVSVVAGASLYRTESATVSTSTSQLVYPWIVVNKPIAVVNGSGTSVAGSKVTISQEGTFNSCDMVSLPITDESVYPTMTSGFKNGYPMTLYPGDIAPQSGSSQFEVFANGTVTPAFITIAGNQYGVRLSESTCSCFVNDTIPPTVSNPKPTVADGYYPNNKDVPISATITDTGGSGLDVSSLQFFYSTSPFSIGNPLSFNFDAATGKLTASLPCVTSDYNLMTVVAKDNCGNQTSMENPARPYYQWSWAIYPTPPGLRTISPDNAENIGISTLTLGGINFQLCGTTAKLQMTGQPDIPCQNVQVSSDGTQATCDANINSVQPGIWKIRMTNPIGGTGTSFVYFNIWDRGPTDLAAVKNLSCGATVGNVTISNWERTYTIIAYNQGTGIAENVQVKDFLPANYNPNNTNPPGVYDPIARTITWNAGNIIPGQRQVFYITNTDAPSLPLTEYHTNIVTTSTTSPDNNLTNNTFSRTTGLNACFSTAFNPAGRPFDPNDKVVSPEGFITTNQTLMYDIHFENIGTGPAINVKITDVLDAHLDVETLYPISNGGFFDPDTRTITWELPNRNLQPGETDAVFFAAKPLSGLSEGTQIKNKATVFFDQEAPIETPEVVSTIGFPRPFADITSPASGAFSNVSQLKIYGAATSFAYSKFSSYTLSYGAGQAPGNFTTFFTGSAEVAGSLLGTLNTTGLSGLYTIKLTVTDTEGHSAEDTTQVYINTPPQITIIGSKGKQNGQFEKPVDVAIDKNKAIYVLDQKEDKNSNAVQKFNTSGTVLLAFGNKDTLKNPVSVEANDTAIYVLDRDANDGKIKAFSQSGALTTSCGSDLTKPVDMSLSGNTLTVLDVQSEASGAVKIYDAENCAFKQQFALTATQSLERAKGISYDTFGNVYVAFKGDANKDFIQLYSPDGTFVKTYGASAFISGDVHADGIVTDDKFTSYVVNSKAQNDAVLGYDAFQNLIFKLGAKGKNSGEFMNPSGIAVSSDGTLVAVADTENNRVQLLYLTGTSALVAKLAPHGDKTEDEDPSVLKSAMLYQNPVRSSQLRFGFPLTQKGKLKAKSGELFISVEVYTISGKKIADITCDAAQEQCNWQQELPNGVYIYRLRAKTLDGKEESKVGKIVVVR